MSSSIAYVPRVVGGKPAAMVERDDLRDLLAAIRDALDVPPGPERSALLGDRALLVGGVLRDVLDGTPAFDIPSETDYLRRTISEGGRHVA
ncbi:hypothetical protein STRCI_001346 [Streptomyces cinnabarinus]|uniref:Poly A polymerase head domain-containing protein n=1 Tax=Streptomyces cinnabarinus TaxID=67287 RepID=A0ABY7K8Y4_9ACTN|nr:hypothetical protein [Streptomyces cinnabarinus]WAZ20245.1 hypothetical protein STRCI_001346 [Streptomyces cinnabarinus]